MKNVIQYSKLEDLKNNSLIKFSPDGDTYNVTKIYDGGIVDLIATKPYNEEIGLNFYEEIFSIKLDKFIIVN